MKFPKNIVVGSLLLILFITGLTYLWWPARTTVADIRILTENDEWLVVDYAGQNGKMYKSFMDDFSEAEFLDWFSEKKWTTIDTLSPRSPSLEAYSDLRQKIFRGESDFLDNRIISDNGLAKFIAVAPTASLVTSKSLLENNRLWFVRDDDLWFQGRYLLKEGVPFTIVDFQERGRHNSPGPRITIWDKKYLGYELKAGWKPQRRQRKYPVPTKEWFDLTVHLKLHETKGQIQIWQNEQLVLDDDVATLAAVDSLLNGLEVGITATDQQAEVWIDHIQISHQPPVDFLWILQ